MAQIPRGKVHYWYIDDDEVLAKRFPKHIGCLYIGDDRRSNYIIRKAKSLKRVIKCTNPTNCESDIEILKRYTRTLKWIEDFIDFPPQFLKYMKNCYLSTCFKFPETFSTTRYFVNVEEIQLRMHRLYEDYGNIEDKLVQWRSILIKFFKKHKPKFLHILYAHHELLYEFVKLLDEVFKICHVDNIKINVRFVLNQGGGGQGPNLAKEEIPVEPLEIFSFLNRLNIPDWGDELFFLSYPKLLTSLAEFDSYDVDEDTFVNLMEVTSFTVLRISGYRN